jgi:phenylpropionate dioxygenase-like ring-hydroxylating dioxygenase large terminal subunit
MTDQQTLRDITRRVINYVETRTTQQVEEVHRVPTSAYRDPDRWQREVDEIFRRKPLALALSAELAEPHQYKALDVTGIPVVLRRGSDGVVRAFHNACRHRGAALVQVGSGKARQLVCSYHGWSYDERGCLTAISQNQTFGELDMSQFPMRELPCEERHGVVWVVLTPGGELDLDEWIGDAAPVLADMKLDSLYHFSTRDFPGPNWKVAMDGYLESYHFPYLHRNTFNKTLHANACEVESLHRHSRMYFARRGIAQLKEIPEEEWEIDNWLGQTLYMFPNAQFAYGFLPSATGAEELPGYGRHCLVHMIYPGSAVGSSVTQQINLTTKPVTTDRDRSTLQNISEESYTVVTGEDYWMGGEIQRTLEFAAPEFLMFGRNEQALTYYHTALDKLLKET